MRATALAGRRATSRLAFLGVILAFVGGMLVLQRPSREPGPGTAREAPGGVDGAGAVRFVKAAESDFDRFTRDPSRALRRWMRTKYWRMRTYSPYFDRRLRWFPDAWVYRDLYAIYRGSPLAREHPEWILRDPRGRRLYIPFECSGGSCPQYAADIGNPAFRRYWIREARASLRRGYRGLFVDDVNLIKRVADGSGDEATPVDPRTGKLMRQGDWRRYLARFVGEIRQAFPRHEVVHNVIWFADGGDPHAARQVAAADYIEIERGVNDARIEAGSRRHGFERLLAYVDRVHDRGKGVILDSYARTDAEREYGLASYFLVSSGRDALGNDPGGSPSDWWRGYDVSLRAPRGPRYRWKGLLRRDFERGLALVNPPGAPRRTVELPGTWRGLDARPRQRVTLDAAAGAVLRAP
jgi:hypothetical protein